MDRQPKRDFPRVLSAILIALSLLALSYAGGPSVATAASPDPEDAVQAFGRDVFVIVGSTLRNPDAGTAPAEPLFTNTGVSLGLTWGQWRAAGATSRAQGSRKDTDVRIQLSGLVPGGIYSLFYGTLGPDTENPLCPGVERTLPLISRNKRQAPDASSFTAGADGSAEFRGQAPGDLFAATQVFFTVIYHFDGMTYGSLPNRGEFLTQGANCRSSFGEDAMRQLIIFQKFQ